MEAILKFDLNDQDDVMAHNRAVKSLDMAICLFEITHNLRKECLYASEFRKLDSRESVEMIFDKINQILDSNNIVMDNLIS